MADNYVQSEVPAMGEIALYLPIGADVVTVEHEENGKLWLCDDYCVCLQTVDSGDLEETLKTLTGQRKDDLALVCVESGEQKRYECVWVSAGEVGDQINRAVIVDDGNYHYVLTLQAEAQNAGSLNAQWKNITSTFAVNTGP